jgi:hypothetical protein
LNILPEEWKIGSFAEEKARKTREKKEPKKVASEIWRLAFCGLGPFLRAKRKANSLFYLSDSFASFCLFCFCHDLLRAVTSFFSHPRFQVDESGKEGGGLFPKQASWS